MVAIIILIIIVIAFTIFILLRSSPGNSFNRTLVHKNSDNVTLNLSQPSQLNFSKGVLDLQKIPLGDGNVSDSPKEGYVYSCMQTFKGGGAEHTGNWINGDTWNLSAKINVEGNVKWPNAELNISVVGDRRIIRGNGLPVNSVTGVYPIQPSDPAYQIDRNPNSVEIQNYSFSIPLNPTFASSPSCVPMGIVGVAINGVALFNGLDVSGRDAVAHEVQDVCSGHPDGSGTYHYHGPSPCISGENQSDTLVGYALDGFGIYSPYDANGSLITDSELDACHGINSTVMWNGKLQKIYHYVLTYEYPYTIGCFRGTPVNVVMGNKKPSIQNNSPPTN